VMTFVIPCSGIEDGSTEGGDGCKQFQFHGSILDGIEVMRVAGECKIEIPSKSTSRSFPILTFWANRLKFAHSRAAFPGKTSLVGGTFFAGGCLEKIFLIRNNV
jgi:hypothetical protein